MTATAHLNQRNQRGLMRETAQGARSRYLSMALASRKLMIRLDSYIKTGEKDASMVEALTNLIKVMETSSQTSNSFAPVPGSSPFGRYDQALIVKEVAEPSIHGMLSGILAGTTDNAVRGETVRKINEFLYDLENRALYKYSEESSEREW